MEFKKSVLRKCNESFSRWDGVLRFQGILCVPNFYDFKRKVLEEVHGSRYSIHPGATKIYLDLREVYWCDGFKRNITEFKAKCPYFK